MQIEIENESYFVDSTRITGKSLKKYLELSVLLRDKLQDCDVDKTKFLEKRAEFISTFFIKNVSANYILNYVQHEDIELYSNLLFNHLLNTKKIDSKIIKLFPTQEEQQVVKEKSVFDDVEVNEAKDIDSLQKVIDIINSLYSFAINNCRCSYYELENKIDWFEFLDYVDYELNRKGKHQEEATEEDIFDKDFD
ncbi:hypothetical protein [Clostridium sp.]|uniref:hypothetical protein n=1 Tax=Clostridium sp. TaxID=1506 RepID=UPI00399634BA